MYSLNFNKFANDFLPAILRKSRLLAFARLSVWALQEVNDDFVDYCDRKFLEASYNGQTIVLEYVLNRRYDLLATSNKIYIDNTGDRFPRKFSFFRAEGQAGIGTAYFEDEGEAGLYPSYYRTEYATEIDFTVYIPEGMVYNEDEVKAIVNRYKVAGKRFNVLTYPI